MDFDTSLLPPGYTAVIKSDPNKKNYCFLAVFNEDSEVFDTSYSISMTQKPEGLQSDLKHAFETMSTKATQYVTNKHMLGL